MGSLTITVPTYAALQTVAQRVTCWAGGVAGINNQRQIQIKSTTPAIVIPEALAAIGPLVLEIGGTDLWAGYVPGTNITFAANNGTATYVNPNTCAASPAQPLITTIAMNVGSNPLAITLNYTNTGAGTVDITWGDGTSTLGAAESGAAAHTFPYRPATFTVRVADASVPATFVETQVYVP
jgi:hypothetical protein